MRSLAILAACAGLAITALPVAVNAQASGQTTTQNDVKAIWEKFKGSWTQTKGAVKEQWAKLTDDDLQYLDGKQDELIGRIQKRTGETRDAVEKAVKEACSACERM